MTIKCPSESIPGLPPKDGRTYRIFWDDPSSDSNITMSTLSYSSAGWVMKMSEHWVGFDRLDRVLAHMPEPLS